MHDDEMSLPLPLTIIIDRVAAGDEDPASSPRAPHFAISSTQHPELSVKSENVDDALEMLLEEVRDAQPMAPSLVEALLAAGHSHELVQEWQRVTWGRRRKYRFDAGATLSALAEYAAHGVPALAACRFFELPLSPEEAGQVYAAGGSPEEADRYLDASATEKWWKWDFEVLPWLVAGFPFDRGRLYVDSCSVEEAIAWEAVVTSRGLSDSTVKNILRLGLTVGVVASGFPTERVGMYVANRVSREAAVAWEDVLAVHDIVQADVSDMIRAGFAPHEVAENMETNAVSGADLGAAARLQLSLAPDPIDPWDIPDRALF